LRVATGSADGVPYPVRRTLQTAAVRRPRTIATVVITAVAVVALAGIVYVMIAHDGKASPAANGAGAGTSAVTPTGTHIDEPAKVTPVVAPVVAKPTAPAPPPPAATAPAPASPPPVKLVAKPKPVDKPAVVAPPAKSAEKKKDTCSDPLDCQY